MTTEGGVNSLGVIFEWDPVTNVYTKKIDLSLTIGCLPYGSLTLSGGMFYGMTSKGGANNCGVIFEWAPATNTYTKKIDLAAVNGERPAGSLASYQGKFYGMTQYGGSNSAGVIFEWDPVTNTYTKKTDLVPATGSNPSGSLTLSGGKFYGMTDSDAANQWGVFFEWDPVTNVYVKKFDLQNATGCYPFYTRLIEFGTVPLTLSGTPEGVTCHGGSDGAINISVLSGTSPYTFSWSNSASTMNVSGLTAGTYTVTVTDSHGCSVTSSTVVTQPPQWMPGLTGPLSVCAESSGNTYLTEPDMSDYQWLVSPGGTIISGGTTSDNSVTISWNVPESQSLSVNYTRPDGCNSTNGLVVTVNPLLPVSISISPSINPAATGTVVEFTAIPVNGGTDPGYQWKINGFNAGTSLSTFSYTPVNYDIVNCVLTSSASCVSGNPAESGSVNMAVTGVPETIAVTGNVVNPQINCYDATQTIMIAGGATTFIIQSGGSATLIAGQKIICQTGTLVRADGYMHLYISDIYCGLKAASVATVPAGNDKLPVTSLISFYKLYPNPTTGRFTLELKGELTIDNLTVEIYSMQGDKVLSEILNGVRRHEFSIAKRPAGLYFIRLLSDDWSETVKIIKQ